MNAVAVSGPEGSEIGGSKENVCERNRRHQALVQQLLPLRVARCRGEGCGGGAPAV